MLYPARARTNESGKAATLLDRLHCTQQKGTPKDPWAGSPAEWKAGAVGDLLEEGRFSLLGRWLLEQGYLANHPCRRGKIAGSNIRVVQIGKKELRSNAYTVWERRKAP